MSIELTGIEVSADLAIIGSVISAYFGWLIAKNKEKNAIKMKEEEELKKLIWENSEKIRDNIDNLVLFLTNFSKIQDERQKILFQKDNANLIPIYEKLLKDFLLKCAIKAPTDIVKDIIEALNNFEFAKKHGNIEIVVFSGVILLYNILEKVRDDSAIANDVIMSSYNISKDEATKKLEEFKNHFNSKNS